MSRLDSSRSHDGWRLLSESSYNLSVASTAKREQHVLEEPSRQSRILVVRVLHDRMDYQRHLEADAGPDSDRGASSSRTPELIRSSQPGNDAVPTGDS